MTTPSVPPRFVPTLTEVVAPSHLAESCLPDSMSMSMPAQAPTCAPDDLTVQRVLKRIDLGLERQLREAVSQLIVNHVQLLAPRLREEISEVVHRCVIQAFKEEAAPRHQPEIRI